MKGIFANRRGFTIAEILMSALFAMIVMAALYGFFRDQLFQFLSLETRTATLEDARGAMNLMVRELRSAGAFWTTTDATCTKDGSGDPMRIVAATASSVQVHSDLDNDGNCSDAGENVTYATSAISITACPALNITRNSQCLVANVVIPGGVFLSYYSTGSSTPLTFPIADLTTIKRIQITFAVQETNPNPNVGGNISYTLSTSVIFRN